MSLTEIHARIATSAVIFAAICALWGIFSYLRRQPVSSSYWGTLIIAELLMLAQGLIGVLLWLEGLRPERGIVHILYGVTAVISLPAAYVYSGGRDSRRENLLYGVVCLWLFGITLRGLTTG